MKTFLLSATLAVLLTQAAAAEALRVGTSADYPPWESVTADGQIVGFDRDFGDELCKRIGADCAWENQAYDGLLPGMQVGKFDLVISGISINAERAQMVDFSAAYADAPNSIGVLAESDLAAINDRDALVQALSGKVIGAQTGTTHEQVIAAHFADAERRNYDRPEQIVGDLLAGRVDAGLMERSAWEPFFSDPANAGKFAYAGPLLTSADFPEFGQGQGVVIGKGKDDLRARVDVAIAAMQADGTIAALSQKWFGYDLSAKAK